MTPSALTKIGIVLCLICLLSASAAAADSQSMVVSLAVSEISIEVDEELRTAGYTVEGKCGVTSVFTVTGGRTAVCFEELPAGKNLHAEITGGRLILGEKSVVIIPQEKETTVSLSLVSADGRNTPQSVLNRIWMITESDSYPLEHFLVRKITSMNITEFLGKTSVPAGQYLIPIHS